MKTAFMVVNIQNDYGPGGILAVTSGNEVVEPTNHLIGPFRPAGCAHCASSCETCRAHGVGSRVLHQGDGARAEGFLPAPNSSPIPNPWESKGLGFPSLGVVSHNGHTEEDGFDATARESGSRIRTPAPP